MIRNGPLAWLGRTASIAIAVVLGLTLTAGVALALTWEDKVFWSLWRGGQTLTTKAHGQLLAVSDGGVARIVTGTAGGAISVAVTPVALGSVVQTDLACSDAGGSLLLNAATITVEVWNPSQTDEVCASLGVLADYTSPKTCAREFEAWGGNGVANLVFRSPSNVAVGASTVYCDMAGGKTSTVSVWEYRQ